MEVGAEEEGNDDWGNPTSDDIPSIARVVSVHSKSSVLDESIEARNELHFRNYNIDRQYNKRRVTTGSITKDGKQYESATEAMGAQQP